MYKTVRHGESSLQYTILPQSDDGGSNFSAKRKHRKRGKTLAVYSLTVVIICGVIASAILVPLLLTSGIRILPEAFQKFSVSSLHRTHSGNRVVVLAKKPAGWDGPHNPTQATFLVETTPSPKIADTTTVSVKTTVTLTNIIENVTKTTQESTTSRTTQNTQWNVTTTMEPLKNRIIVEGTEKKGNQKLRIYPTNLSQTDKSDQDQIPWYQLTVIEWPINKKQEKLLVSLILGGLGLTCIFIAIVVIWMKKRRLRRSRVVIENITDEGQKADKVTLLTEPTQSDDEP